MYDSPRTISMFVFFMKLALIKNRFLCIREHKSIQACSYIERMKECLLHYSPLDALTSSLIMKLGTQGNKTIGVAPRLVIRPNFNHE